MTLEEIKAAIERGIPGAQAVVRNPRKDGKHFEAVVAAERFRELGLLEQHQEVYRTLGSAVGNEIHALALKTCTPEAFEQAAGPA